MKKFNLIILVVAASAVMLASCTKNEGLTEVLSVKEQPVEEVISYTINKGNLIKELEALMKGREKSNYNTVKISFDAALSVYQIIIDVTDDLPPLDIVCQGDGYSFATCVRDFFERNSDGCLVITYDDGTYTADDNCP